MFSQHRGVGHATTEAEQQASKSDSSSDRALSTILKKFVKYLSSILSLLVEERLTQDRTGKLHITCRIGRCSVLKASSIILVHGLNIILHRVYQSHYVHTATP